uniref:Pentacotripeptide-repeat region of PRORP domain-containing protein n=1 Tax=Entomoneis paludosa TaxID=265537 RepID=A0A7S3DQB4_9STRA
MFRDRHGFNSAYEMFHAIKTPRRGMSLSREKVVENLFLLLDLLSEEARKVNSQTDEGGRPVRALPGKLFGSILLEWRDHIRDEARRAATPQQSEGGAFQRNLESLDRDLGDMSPTVVKERVQQYFDSGILTPTPVIFNIILSALDEVTARQNSTVVGEEIFQNMLERSKFNCQDLQCHPDATTAQEMMRLWAHSGLDEATERVDYYLNEVKAWHEQTKRKDMKPTINMYCYAIETCGRSSQDDAISRIQNLFAEMKATKSFDLNAISYSRVCCALANCNQPGSCDAARMVFDEVLQKFEQSHDKKRASHLMPRKESYLPLLKAYIRERRTLDAVTLIQDLDDCARRLSNPMLRPDDSHRALVQKKETWGRGSIVTTEKSQLQNDLDGLLPGIPVQSARQGDWNRVLDFLKTWRKDPSQVNVLRGQLLNRLWNTFDSFSAEAMMLRGTHEQTSSTGPFLAVDERTFGSILVAWRNSLVSTASAQSNHGGKNDPSFQELNPVAVFEKMIRCVDAGLVEPSPQYIDIILEALQTLKSPDKAPYYGHRLFQHMLQRSQYDPTNTQQHPTKKSMQQMIHLWRLSCLPEAAEKAESCLSELDTWSQRTKLEEYQLEPRIYCSVMETHSAASPPDIAIDRIKKLFVEMKNKCPEETLNGISYTRVCVCLSRSRHPDAGDAVRDVLNEMLKLFFEEDIRKFKPNQHIFNAALTAYGRAGQPDKALELIEEMEQLSKQTGDSSFYPNNMSYSALIWAYAKKGDIPGAQSALLRMQKEHGNFDVDIDAWDGVLTAWAASGDPGAVKKITEMIDWIKTNSGGNGNALSRSTYNTLMAGHAQQGTKAAAQSADDLCKWMSESDDKDVKPDYDTYKNQLLAWKNAEDPDRADKTLRTLCEQVRKGALSPTVLGPTHFTIVIGAWANSKQPEAHLKATHVFKMMKDMNMRPTVVSYNSLLWAWARNNSTDPGKPVEQLFQEMLREWRKDGDILKPDGVTYNALLRGLSRSSDAHALDRAEMYFEQMKGLGIKQNAHVYTTLIGAWAQRKKPDCADALFQRMKEGYLGGDEALKPTEHVYSVINWAWCASDHPEQATEVLNEWVAAVEAGNLQRKPNSREFGGVLQAWLRSDRPDAAERAESVLELMIQSSADQGDSLPNVVSFSSVISAYVKSKAPHSGERALNLLKVQKKLAEKHGNTLVRPNFLTYSGVMMALILSGGGSAEVELDRIMDELADKEDGFFREFRTTELLGKIKTALHRSPFPSKSRLLHKCEKLESSCGAQTLS